MMRNAILIFRKELRETLRDKRTLFVMVVLPLLVYPLLMVGFGHVAMVQAGKLERQVFRVVVVGGSRALELTEKIRVDPHMLLVKVQDPDRALKDRRIQVWIEFPEELQQRLSEGGSAKAVVHYDGADEKSSAAMRRLRDILLKYARHVRDERLKRLGLDRAFVAPIEIETRNAAGPKRMAAAAIGPVLALLMVVFSATGAFYPALDICAGERERGTLETLLVSPALREEIVAGKLAVIMLVAVVTAVLNLASMWVSFACVWRMVQPEEVSAVGLSLSMAGGVVCLLLLIPLAAMFSAVCLALCTFARSYREGQYYLSPLFLVVVPLSFIAMVPNVEPSIFYSFIPVTNVAMVLKQLFRGELPWGQIAATSATTLALAGAAVAWAVSMYKRETVLFRAPGGEWRPAPSARPGPGFGDAVFIFAACFALFWYVGGLMPRESDALNLVTAEYGFVLLPALLYVRAFRFNARAAFHARPIGPRVAVWVVLATLSATIVIMAIAMLQNLLFDFTEEQRIFQERIRRITELGWGAGFVLIAATPALCEEMLFRGFILSGLLKRGRLVAVILSSAFFAFLHLRPMSLLPIFLLGMFLAYLVLLTGSVWTSILAHMVYNGFVLLLWTVLGDAGDHGGVLLLMMPVAAVLFVAGMRKLRAVTRRSREVAGGGPV